MESWSIKSSANVSAPEPTAKQDVAAYGADGMTPFGQALPRSFYDRGTLEVARDLLGKLLVVRSNPAYGWDDPRAGVTHGRVVETEAYHGTDPASHSARGLTPRNSIMFGEPGVAYIYFIYGMYEMLNFVTESEGYPGAVLIRALEPVSGITRTTNGPGRLCRAMSIRMSHKGESLQGPVFYVLDDGVRPRSVMRSPRVGINVGKEPLWRFFVDGNSHVSRAPENRLARRHRPRVSRGGVA